MTPKQNPKRTLLLLIAATGLSTSAFAVEAPYTENFDSYPDGGTPGGFSTALHGGGVYYQSSWNTQNPNGSAGTYRNYIQGDFVQASSAIAVTNLTQSDFILSTTFVVNGFGAFSSTYERMLVGLGAFATGPDFYQSGYRLSYVLNNSYGGFPQIGSLQLSGSSSGTYQNPIPVVRGATYTMTLSGIYSSSGLLLTGTLDDGTHSLALTVNDPTPSQGTYFGYYDEASGLTNHAVYADVSYDNFSISVPEPRSICLLGLGILLLAGGRLSRRWISP